MHINHTLSNACQNGFDFGEFLVLTPSFIGTPLKSHYELFSRQFFFRKPGLHIAM